MKRRISYSLYLMVISTISMVLLSSIVSIDSNQVKNVVSEDTWVKNTLEKLSLEEKIGQFFMIAAYSNKGEEYNREIESIIEENQIGGLIFFQGDRTNFKSCVDRFQRKSKVPLLIGMDAEWGIGMRLFGEDRFPYNYTIGAANDPILTEKIGEMIGQECRDIGVHINFAPVADVNSNPNNPVIGFRSYGEYPKDVASHVAATVKGVESQGVLTSIKHFPGHGDTDVDSHYDLPIVNNSYNHINAIDFFPFRSGIRAGASSVMIGHLNVPALDSTGTPSSLSYPTIQGYLKGELGFKGLVISDALNMKAVADKYGKTDVVVKAFEAGIDILLFPESVAEAIEAIKKKVVTGVISEEVLNKRCRKILEAKYKTIISPKKIKRFTQSEVASVKKQLFEKAITVLRNTDNVLPIKRLDSKIALVTIGSHTNALVKSMENVGEVDHFHFYSGLEAVKNGSHLLKKYDYIITSIHARSVVKGVDFGMPKGWKDWITKLPRSKKNIVSLFANPLAIDNYNVFDGIESIIIGYENHPLMLDRAGQLLMGTFGSEGTLPISICSSLKRGNGLRVVSGGRLKMSQPEAFGIDPIKLSEIDSIVNRSIKAKAFPGCQVVVALKGSVIYKKSFGFHTYEGKIPVKDDDVYDIASVTKIAASTLSLMRLNTLDKFSLKDKLGDYLPELTAGTRYASTGLRNMMAHQAGFQPWIPFYTQTMRDGELRSDIYNADSSAVFNTPVANGLWIKSSYADSIYRTILSARFRSMKYKYSDLGYYFAKKIIEKQTGQSLDEYVINEFYAPMGLKSLRYHPLKYFKLNQIPPTEDDQIFRKKLVHGYVHDQGAAMLGGVGGHAGLFSNATDLASLMQMFLNEGTYGGVQYISPQVIKEYTSCQFCPKNRRGAGFDKPTTNLKGGPTSELVSLKSFGHSGFTGTLVWADPVNEVNYVFLSNRVYPDAENWKIVKMNIRTEIQDVIYEALNNAEKL